MQRDRGGVVFSLGGGGGGPALLLTLVFFMFLRNPLSRPPPTKEW